MNEQITMAEREQRLLAKLEILEAAINKALNHANNMYTAPSIRLGDVRQALASGMQAAQEVAMSREVEK